MAFTFEKTKIPGVIIIQRELPVESSTRKFKSENQSEKTA